MSNAFLFNNRVQSPCKNCEDRMVGCHSTCEKYKAFQQENDANNKIIRENRKKENDIVSFRVEAIRKYNKTGTNNRKS